MVMFRLLLALLALLVSSLLHAYPATSAAAFYSAQVANSGYNGSTSHAACSSWAAANAAANPGSTYAIDSVTAASCSWRLIIGGNPYNHTSQIFFTAAASSCPSGGALSGGSCVCSAPAVDTGSSCSDPNIAKCQAAKDGSDLFTGFSTPPTLGAAFCPSDGAASSCASKVTGAFAIVKNGVKVWTYEVGYSGALCTPPPPSSVGTPTTCKGSPGTVNGVAVCIPATDQNVVESVKQTTTTAPVSAASAPGSAGSTSTSDLGICSGSTCSVTRTTSVTTSAGGVPVVTVTKTDMPKDDYCKQNPRAISCKDFNLGDVAGQPIANKTVDLGITKAASFGPENASCPAPKTAVIMGKSIAMPFTLLCEFAQLIRPLLIGFAYLSAALTFFGFARK